MNQPSLSSADRTKEALLDAAERLFAERSITGTSVRAVTAAAGANVAAVNYHFGSKDELILAVLDRRLGPLNAERLALLDHAEQVSAPDGPSLEQILHALVAPAFQLSEAGLRRFTKMLARSHFDTDPSVQDLIVSRFETVIERFIAALGRELPELAPSELFFRLHFAIGALAMTVCNLDTVGRHSRGHITAEQIHDYEELSDRLVRFLAEGFRAPAPGGRR